MKRLILKMISAFILCSSLSFASDPFEDAYDIIEMSKNETVVALAKFRTNLYKSAKANAKENLIGLVEHVMELKQLPAKYALREVCQIYSVKEDSISGCDIALEYVEDVGDLVQGLSRYIQSNNPQMLHYLKNGQRIWMQDLVLKMTKSDIDLIV